MYIREQRLDPNMFLSARPDFTDAGTDTQERAVGWHTGEVGKGVLRDLYGDEESEEGGTGIEWKWIMLLGFAWESYMVRRVPSESGTIWQPGEMGHKTGLVGKSKDGRDKGWLYGNVDGYSPEAVWEGKQVEGAAKAGLILPVLEEFKFTKKTSNKGPEHKAHFGWRCQIKTYLKMLELEYGGEHRWARLWACFVNDDYKYGGGDGPEPYVACWWFEFTQKEIDDNWRMLITWLSKQ